MEKAGKTIEEIKKELVLKLWDDGLTYDGICQIIRLPKKDIVQIISQYR
ncbi:MAG: hypothetical protein ACTSXD_13480 [Candidatus Heimdallarchaeaceae archaeon]